MSQDAADKKVVGKAFKVEINGQFLPIKSYSGGKPSSTKAVRSRHGKMRRGARKSVTELTLVAYITPDQNILADMATKIANQGKNERFKITVTEMAKDKSVVKTFVYDECLFTSLDFPTLSSSSGEILCQTATFKPQILDVS